MPETIIADTSVLIALADINELSLLCEIYKEVILPEAVIKEFGYVNLNCISVKKIESRLLNFH